MSSGWLNCSNCAMARISPAESVLETSNVHGDPDRKPPPLTLAIIIVGTKGDCLPFIALAHRLSDIRVLCSVV